MVLPVKEDKDVNFYNQKQYATQAYTTCPADNLDVFGLKKILGRK